MRPFNPQALLQYFTKLPFLKWFGEKIIAPGIECQLAIRFKDTRGERHNRQRTSFELSPQPAGSLEAIRLGHPQVHENEIGIQIRTSLEAILTIDSFFD